MPVKNRLFWLKFLLAWRINKRRKQRVRSLYIRPIFKNRNSQGDLSLVRELAEDPMYHHRYFRMSKENFEYILEKIKGRLHHGLNHSRPITALERLAITLRYLATGNSQISLGMSYRISAPSVSTIVREVMEAICAELQEFLSEPNKKKWESITNEFETKWGFPMCCGAVDRKHIRVKAPPHSGSQHCNYKGYFSIVLMAVVDANYRFSLVHIGSSGSNSDGGVFKKSDMGKKLANDGFDFPDPKLLSTGDYVPPVIVGDDAFPLKPYLMKPYSGKSTCFDTNVFNYRLSRARMVVENAFGILAARWRIFHGPIDGTEYLARLITKTTVILHNFLMVQNDTNGITTDREDDGVVIRGSWRDIIGDSEILGNLERQGSNNSGNIAYDIREKFKNYFLSEQGSLSWQADYVRRGYE